MKISGLFGKKFLMIGLSIDRLNRFMPMSKATASLRTFTLPSRLICLKVAAGVNPQSKLMITGRIGSAFSGTGETWRS